MDKSLAFLCMSHDEASGKITFHTETDDISVSYEDVGYEPNFKVVDDGTRKVTEKLGGTFVSNPLWTEHLGKSVITVHPLGGCPMAESGQSGVVNHAGQVFEGKHIMYSCVFDRRFILNYSLQFFASYI
jgi:cholesterol oxidase